MSSLTSLAILGSILQLGNLSKFGLDLDKTANKAQMANEATHWYHVMNIGASNFNLYSYVNGWKLFKVKMPLITFKSEELNKYLLINTMDMETTLFCYLTMNSLSLKDKENKTFKYQYKLTANMMALVFLVSDSSVIFVCETID